MGIRFFGPPCTLEAVTGLVYRLAVVMVDAGLNINSFVLDSFIHSFI